MQIPDEMLKEIRESGYDQELVFKMSLSIANKLYKEYQRYTNNR